MGCDDKEGTNEISGTNPCGVTGVPYACVSPCSCNCSPCNCGSAKPFYNQAQACQEEHTTVCIDQTYTAVVTVGAAFNMPECDESITVKLPGLQKLQIGGYLWSSQFGYLAVASFDCMTETAVLRNDCQAGNAAAGTLIPACSQFNVVDPPYEAGSDCGEGVFVVQDFVVPVLNGSVTVDVNNVAGLTIGIVVQVGVGQYLLTAIPTTTSVTLKNFGGVGVVPGATIDVKDSLGHCVAAITPYGVDACTETAQNTGSIVVCTEGALTTLNATALGQVPVCIDADENIFEAQDTYIEIPDCTYLTACLVLMSGTNSYTLNVDSSAGFSAGQVLVVSYPGIDATVWVVTSVPTATRIVVEDAAPPNVVNMTVPESTRICHGSCCQQVSYNQDNVCSQDWSDAQKAAYDIVYDEDQTSGLISSGGSFTSATKTIEFTNDTCNTMLITLTVDYILQFSINTNEGSWARYAFIPYTGQTTSPVAGTPGVPVQAPLRTLTEDKAMGIGSDRCDSYDAYQVMQYHHTEIVSLPANTKLRYDAHGLFNYLLYKAGSVACCPCVDLGPEGTGKATVTDINTYLHAIGIAIQAA